MGISYNYDTTAIRREARKLKSCYERLTDSAMPRVNGARSKLDGNFMGRTADALDESLARTQTQLKALSRDINGLYAALMRFADALEEADDRVAQLMRK